MLTIPGVEPSRDLITRLAREHSTILLSFSAGKDSILAWLILREHFNIVPYYAQLVPGLEFIEDSLVYYEQFFATKILRVPHPSLYRMWNNMVFMPPERCAIAQASSLPDFTYDDLADALRGHCKLDMSTPVASGVRAADSIIRRIHFKTRGCYNQRTRQFYPVWDWTIAELEQEFLRAKIALPIDYWLFGRSFDGLDYRFLKPIHDHFPADYQRILEYFPLAELELHRARFAHRSLTSIPSLSPCPRASN